MLKVFRENLKSLTWILWVVIGVFVLLIFFDYGAGYSTGSAGGRSAAKVGGQEISFGEYQRAHRDLDSRYRMIYGEQYNQIAEQLQVPAQALQGLIDGKILSSEAEKLGLAVGDDEVRRTVRQAMSDESGKFIGAEAYERAVRNLGFGSESRYEQWVRDQLLRQKLIETLRQTVAVSDAEIEAAYREQVDRASIRYVQLPRGKFTTEVAVSADEVAQRFAATKDEYRLPEQRVAAYVLVDKVILRNQLPISDDELRAYYDSHQSDLSNPERVHARHILLKTDGGRTPAEAISALEEVKKKVSAGADFAQFAREMSEDDSNKAQGGDLGYFQRNQMVPEFDQAAFNTPAGQMAGPLTTSFGVHLIQVLDHQQAGVMPFDQAKPVVRARLAGERVDGAALALAQELLTKLGSEAPTAEKLQALPGDNQAVRFAETKPFGKTDVIPGLGRVPDFANAVFALEAGKLASGPINTNRGPALVLLKEIKPPRVPELAEVEPQVRRKIESERQQTLAMGRLAGLKSAVLAGKSLDDVATELGVVAQDSGEFAKNGSIQGLGFDRAVIDAAFAARAGEVVGPVASTNGAVLFKVVERKGFDPVAFQRDKQATREGLEGEQLNRRVGAILQARRQELGVTYDPDVAQQLGLGPAAEKSSGP